MALSITIDKAEGHVPVTIVRLSGELDGSNYATLIEQGHELYAADARNLLLDLSDLTFMSSSGLVALHSLALIMRGGGRPDEGGGWSSFHTIASDIETATGTEKHFKLSGPQPRVRKTLETTGFDQILEIFEDEQTALQSF
jgi:anti-anti-sigma factor